MTTTNNRYDHITEEFDIQKDLLERQIIGIELRQQEIQSHITSIEAANNQLDIMINQEKDNRKKGSYFAAKVRNIELLTKLYSVYREFEDSKFKYHNNMSDIIYKGHRLIEVDIRKLDEKLDSMTGDDMVDMFKNLNKLFSSNKQLSPEIENEIIVEEDEYKL